MDQSLLTVPLAFCFHHMVQVVPVDLYGFRLGRLPEAVRLRQMVELRLRRVMRVLVEAVVLRCIIKQILLRFSLGTRSRRLVVCIQPTSVMRERSIPKVRRIRMESCWLIMEEMLPG